MARRSGYFFAVPPFGVLARHLVSQDEAFEKDAQFLLKLDQDSVHRLAAQLQRTDAFLNRPELESITQAALGESDASKRIAAIIYRLGGVLHDADKPVERAMNALAAIIEDDAPASIKPDDRRVLNERIRILVAESRGLAKQHKAQQLVEAIGSELDDFQFVCDIRPVFDRARERVEGAIPITVLRLDFTEPDGDTNVVELRVTEKQIESLEGAIATAKRKLKQITALLASYQVAVPMTEAADSDRNENADLGKTS